MLQAAVAAGDDDDGPIRADAQGNAEVEDRHADEDEAAGDKEIAFGPEGAEQADDEPQEAGATDSQSRLVGSVVGGFLLSDVGADIHEAKEQQDHTFAGQEVRITHAHEGAEGDH